MNFGKRPARWTPDVVSRAPYCPLRAKSRLDLLFFLIHDFYQQNKYNSAAVGSTSRRQEGPGRARRVAQSPVTRPDQGKREIGFVRAADLVDPGQEEGARGDASSKGPADATDAGNGEEEIRGTDGAVGTGASDENGGNGGNEDDEVYEGDGLGLFKWEPGVFSLTTSRPTAEFSGFEYVSRSEVSKEGCSKESCAVAPRAEGEVGACYCPVPLDDPLPLTGCANARSSSRALTDRAGFQCETKN